MRLTRGRPPRLSGCPGTACALPYGSMVTHCLPSLGRRMRTFAMPSAGPFLATPGWGPERLARSCTAVVGSEDFLGLALSSAPLFLRLRRSVLTRFSRTERSAARCHFTRSPEAPTSPSPARLALRSRCPKTAAPNRGEGDPFQSGNRSTQPGGTHPTQGGWCIPSSITNTLSCARCSAPLAMVLRPTSSPASEEGGLFVVVASRPCVPRPLRTCSARQRPQSTSRPFSIDEFVGGAIGCPM